jgi:hypothetical protein
LLSRVESPLSDGLLLVMEAGVPVPGLPGRRRRPGEPAGVRRLPVRSMRDRPGTRRDQR